MGSDCGEVKRPTVVIKVGTSSLIRELSSESGSRTVVSIATLSRLCEVVASLHASGNNVIIVTSGAVGVGCQRLGLKTRPTDKGKKQALAAIGQVHLMKYYEDFLGALGLTCAQVLLTLDNLADSVQYQNARNTFLELMAYGAVPVVNENDTVAVTQEHRFGDNDTLSAQVAALVEAEWLFLLTDVDCLYTANPKDDPDAAPVWEVDDICRLNADTSTRGTQWGTGGMATKLTAGRIATAAGSTMVICSFNAPENVLRIKSGEQKLGTVFHPLPHSLRGRKRWILSVPVRGCLWLDDVAVRSVRDRRLSLFANGLVKVEGEFHAQDNVSLCDASGVEFARGLVNMDHQETGLHIGRRSGSRSRHARRGAGAPEEMVHKENLVLLSTSVDGDSDEDPQLCTDVDVMLRSHSLPAHEMPRPDLSDVLARGDVISNPDTGGQEHVANGCAGAVCGIKCEGRGATLNVLHAAAEVEAADRAAAAAADVASGRVPSRFARCSSLPPPKHAQRGSSSAAKREDSAFEDESPADLCSRILKKAAALVTQQGAGAAGGSDRPTAAAAADAAAQSGSRELTA